MHIPENIKRYLRPVYGRIKGVEPQAEMDVRWLEVQRRLAAASGKIIDLGCGNYPVKGAAAAVDLYIEPKQRLSCAPIDAVRMKGAGIKFVNSRIDAPLPFRDKEFDFAFSHHVFEHVEDPAIACREMMRIARSGAIITPSFLAEMIFGREYHRWMVMERGNKLFFFRKRPFEDRPFGELPKCNERSGAYIVEGGTNPFDLLLNDGGRYKGSERMPRLSRKLRKMWYSHSPAIEVIFIWDDKFDFAIYD
jgi:SAM-dependent methyltransferase